MNKAPCYATFNLRFVFFFFLFNHGSNVYKNNLLLPQALCPMANYNSKMSQLFQMKSFQQMTPSMSGLCGHVGKLGMRLSGLILKNLVQPELKRPAEATDVYLLKEKKKEKKGTQFFNILFACNKTRKCRGFFYLHNVFVCIKRKTLLVYIASFHSSLSCLNLFSLE